MTLFHLGVLHEPLRKTRTTAGARQRAEWDAVASDVAGTVQGYLAQLTLTRRPATVRQVEGTLRDFALFLLDAADVTGVSDIRRRHVEAYRRWLAKRPAQGHSRPVTRKPQAKQLAILRSSSNASSSDSQPTLPPPGW